MMQFFNAQNAIFLGALAYIGNILKGWIFSAIRFIMRRYSMSYTATGSTRCSKLYDALLKIATPHGAEILANNKINIDDVNSLDFGGYVIKLGRFTWGIVFSSRLDTMNYLTPYLSIQVIGRNRKKILKEIEYLSDPYNDKSVKFRKIITKMNASYLAVADKISFNAYNPISKKLFGKCAYNVIDDIKHFLDTKDLYDKFHRKFKHTILIHGAPGTGKSSLINNIVNEFNIRYTVYLQTSDAGDLNAIRSAPSNELQLLVIEDIDKLMLGGADFKDQNVFGSPIAGHLMQFLDSSTSLDNIIILITTNHLEKLEKSMVRKGRVDTIIEMKNLNRTEAEEMVEYYGLGEFKLKKDLEEFNPAELENAIFERMYNK